MITSTLPTVRPCLAGRDLRYFLAIALTDRGPATTAELVAAVDAAGFALRGRSSKTVADAIRWEVARGRIVRLGRARYAPGHLPKTTAWRMRRRLRDLRAGSPLG